MRTSRNRLLPAVWFFGLLLMLNLTPLASAQQAQKPQPDWVKTFLLPGSPLDMLLAAPGIQPPLIYETSVAHTRPERANPNRPVGPQFLQEGQALGSEGVVDAGRFILPFGTKGEKVALAFLSGEYVPPQGEKLQPALARLAQARAAQLSTLGSDAKPTVYALILLNGRMDEALQAWLQERGVEVLGFYPYTARLARIPVDALNAVASHPQVRWVGQPSAVQKLDPELLYFMGDQSGEQVWLYVSLFTHDEGAKAAIENMASQTGVYDPSLGVFAIVADAATVNRLLDMDAVLFVEPIRPAHVMHTESQASINADLLWSYGHDGRPEGGRPIKVGVMDSGLSYHQDLYAVWGGTAGYNRTSEQSWWNDLNGHGTLVTGTFIGEGRAQFRYRGTAQGVRDTDVDGYDLLFSKVFRADGVSEGDSVYQGLLDMQGRQERFKRQVFNFSGGSEGTDLTGTDATSRKVDELFQQNIVPVIAAGNKGPGSGTITSPGVAKGAFTVGAIFDDYVDSVDRIPDYSSRGYTGDDRRKPDVVAPGSWIDSCSHSDSSGYALRRNGTSMAAPHVAGLVAGLIGHYNMPAWATKSTLLASTIGLGRSPAEQGLGKVDAMLAHFGVDGGWKTSWATSSGTGSLQTIDFALSQTVRELRIVLVYPDAPAPAGGSVALKNDLDLYLDKEPFSSGASGEWSSTSGRDNVEVIYVSNATAGNYRIKVYNYDQNEGSTQTWAVTRRYIVGDMSPNVTISLSAPVAVKPNVNFDVYGAARADSYVASGVHGDIDLLTAGLTLNGMTYVRWAPDFAEESVHFTDRDGMNQGNIPAGIWRRLVWSVKGTPEGGKDIRYTIRSINGGTASVTRTVIVDGTAPGNWQGFLPDWADEPTPDCSIQVQDTLSGLSTAQLVYYYWTSGTGVQGPFDCTTTAANGSTALERITASNVPFNQEGATGQNQIYFRAYDRAGNLSDSGWKVVKIDFTDPQDWRDFTVTNVGTTGLTPTCTVRVRDVLSGLATSGAWYRYSTDGGSTWSWWRNASITGAKGTTDFQTVTASDVPFNQQSATENRIQFWVSDVAGNWGYSPIYTVPTKYATMLSLNNSSGTIGQFATLTATLRRVVDNAPLSGKSIRFIVDGETAGPADTNASGAATLYWVVTPGELGNRALSVSFAGDRTTYHGTTDTATFRRYANTTIQVSSVSGMRGERVLLTAQLTRTHDGAVIAGRTLNFKVDGNPVGSTVTNSSGVASNYYSIPGDAALGDHVIEVHFAGDDPLNPSGGRGTLTVAPTMYRIGGQVELQDYVADPTDTAVTIELRNPGDTTPLETHIVLLDGNTYAFSTTRTGTFDVAAKASHWLRQVRGSIPIVGNTTVNFSLVNGDVDSDNEVTLFDFGQLVAAFGTIPGDTGWNANADLDGDEEVTLFDFGILVRNFGIVGDE